MIAIVTMMPSATTQPEKKRKTALASVQGDQHHFFQIKYQLYLYHPYHILNCWLWLCNFQAQFWCWRSSRIDYHNYLTIWPCQIFRLSQLSDALCEIYRLTREQQFDSTLSKHLFWRHSKMHGKTAIWCNWSDNLTVPITIKKWFSCHSIAMNSYIICFIKCRWNNLSWNNKHKGKKIKRYNICRLKGSWLPYSTYLYLDFHLFICCVPWQR